MYDLGVVGSPSEKVPSRLTRIICWSRMQTEAGQPLHQIVRRKELERQANGGVFVWGVGNPPAKAVRQLALSGDPIDAVFSVMKSRPKSVDVAPEAVFLWRGYIDQDGRHCRLPEGSIVTSRSNTQVGTKSAHYALVCRSL